ncbi:hypothetical protein HK405_009777, partial [Cladochytrium tenue]
MSVELDEPSNQDFVNLVRRAELGDATSQCELGALHEDGRSAGLTHSDLVEAVRWYNLAGRTNAEAQRRLAQLYQDGRG